FKNYKHVTYGDFNYLINFDKIDIIFDMNNKFYMYLNNYKLIPCEEIPESFIKAVYFEKNNYAKNAKCEQKELFIRKNSVKSKFKVNDCNYIEVCKNVCIKMDTDIDNIPDLVPDVIQL